LADAGAQLLVVVFVCRFLVDTIHIVEHHPGFIPACTELFASSAWNTPPPDPIRDPDATEAAFWRFARTFFCSRATSALKKGFIYTPTVVFHAPLAFVALSVLGEFGIPPPKNWQTSLIKNPAR